MHSIIGEYQRSLALLTELFPLGRVYPELLPSKGESHRWRRFSTADGQEALAIVQRVDLGVLSSSTQSRLRQDLFGTIADGGNGRGFQPIAEPMWIPRNPVEDGKPSALNNLDATLLSKTDDLLIVPLEVFGFASPESPAKKNRLNSWMRPAFHVVAGREFCERRWLTPPDSKYLFGCGYTFLPGKLRPSPYPYGPGAFDRATKCYEFVQNDSGTVEVWMLAVMLPSLAQHMKQKLSWLGAAGEQFVLGLGLEKAALDLHVQIHAKALLNAAKTT